jgi:hypothetical protein
MIPNNPGINVMGTLVPTDFVQLCFLDEHGVNIGSKRVYHIGLTRNRSTVLVTDRGHFWYDRVPKFKQFRLNRTQAEALWPATPALKQSQALVERIISENFESRIK